MRKALLFLIGWIGIILPMSATTFTVNVNDGGWGNASTPGTLAKAIADFNAAGAGSHTINVTITLSLNDPSKWAINNSSAALTINGNNNTVDGPGYGAWTLNVTQLTINNWTMTAGFNSTAVPLGGTVGHTFNNASINNVAFTFTVGNNSFVNSSFSGYTMNFNNSNTNNINGCNFSTMNVQFSNSSSNTITNTSFSSGTVSFASTSNTNTITGCTFSTMPVTFNNSSTTAISNSIFTVGGISLAAGSNNSTIYGCKFNTNPAGTALVTGGLAFDIKIDASTGTIIGANNSTQRNIFALSSSNSIALSGASASTKIIGNYFGTDITGGTSLSGTGTNSTISITASQNVIIDSNIVSSMQGTTGGAIEVVSGNCNGLKIRYNLIGVNKSGTGGSTFQNKNYGIVLSAGTVNNLDIIGNTISRSVSSGIRIDANVNPLTIQNNFIGSNSSGLYDGTDYGNGHGGIILSSGTIANVTISGNTIVRNGWVTQDNFSCGLYVISGVNTITVSNNHIGVYADNTSTGPSGNSFAGMFLFSTCSNVTISNNVIGANGMGNTKSHGIATAGSITNISILDNYIGVSPSGALLGNGNSGIDLQNVTTGTISGNYIGANQGKRTDIPAAGIALSNGTTLVSITGNYIGLTPSGTAAGQQLNGSYDGSAIRAEGTASKINIDNNDLAYSAGNGVNVIGGADYVEIFNNRIYCNTAKGINLNCSGISPNGPGNSSFGCGTITLNTFTPVPTTVSGGRPTNSVVYVYGTNSCAAGACGTNPQGQFLFTGGTMTYPTGTTWNYNNGTPMYNDITALAVGTGTNCSSTYCRTSEFSNCVDNTLPVSLIAFTALVLEDGSVSLVWQTVAEINNAYFVIERSKDGQTFEPIGNIAGKGTYTQLSTYQFSDPAAVYGITYYRLKQVDFNGAYTYSPLKEVTITSANVIAIVPNPNSGSFTVTASNKGHYTITISSVLGQPLYQWSVNAEAALEKSFETSLSTGTYLIQITSEEAQVIRKMIVE